MADDSYSSIQKQFFYNFDYDPVLPQVKPYYGIVHNIQFEEHTITLMCPQYF